jgi:hypothetical protein
MISLIASIVKSGESLSRLVVQLLFLERTFKIDQSPKHSEQLGAGAASPADKSEYRS